MPLISSLGVMNAINFGLASIPTNSFLAIGGLSTPYVQVYNWGGSGFGSGITNPAILPPTSLNDVCFSPKNDYIVGATTSAATYYLSGYPFSKLTGFGTLLTNPTSGNRPGSLPYSITFSPTGSVLLETLGSAPYVWASAFTTGYGTKYADPTTAISGGGFGSSFNSTTTAIAISSASAPYIQVYPWSSGFGTKYANPATAMGSIGRDTFFSPNGSYLAITSDSAPYITVYNWASGFGSKISDPATLPVSRCFGGNFSCSGNSIGLACDTIPYIYVYPWTTGFGSVYANPTTLPTGAANDIVFSPTNQIAIGFNDTIGINTYPFDTTTGYGAKYTDPAAFNVAYGYGVTFSN
jgi:hypothetical protein